MYIKEAKSHIYLQFPSKLGKIAQNQKNFQFCGKQVTIERFQSSLSTEQIHKIVKKKSTVKSLFRKKALGRDIV